MRRALLAALAALATSGGLAGCHAAVAESVLVPPPGAGTPAPAAAPDARRRDVARDPAPEFALEGFGACVRVDGRVHCGALGSAQPLSAQPPLAGVDDAVDVALGPNFGCVVRAGGGVACFGANHYGELGAGLAEEESPAPVPVVGVAGATRVFAGPVGACALVEGGRAYCWGLNNAGQTGGDAVYLPEARESNLPVRVKRVEGAVQLALGRETSCARDRGGHVMCWGAPAVPASPPLVEATYSFVDPSPIFDDVRDLTSSSREVFCGVSRGSVSCWGHRDELYVGHDLARLPEQPALLAAGLRQVKRVRLGFGRGCALHQSGDVSCWENDRDRHVAGEAAPGEASEASEAGGAGERPAVRVVAGLPPAVDVVVYDRASCAVTAAHDVYCWGAWPDEAGAAVVRAPKPVKMRVR